MTTGKTRWTFIGKVMSLLFNMLSRLVIAFLPRSKRLLISWLQSPSAVISESKKIKPVTVSIVSLSICYEVMGLEAMILVFLMLSFNTLPSRVDKIKVALERKAWWLRRKRIRPQCRRPGFDPWVGKILCKRAWQPTPMFLPEDSPWTVEAWQATVHGVAKSQTWLSD